MASKVKPSGSTSTREEQVIKPEVDSDALHRRAKEFSSDIQRESVMDNEKVKRIKKEIENGTYEVDANAIAEKLLESDFQLED